jgi:outer membrane protein assembly factor BamB
MCKDPAHKQEEEILRLCGRGRFLLAVGPVLAVLLLMAGAGQSALERGATVSDAPTVAGVTPGWGLPGASVKITGTGFTGAKAVRFNGVKATAFTVVSDTLIRAKVPDGATKGWVKVTTDAGVGQSPKGFDVLVAGVDWPQYQRDPAKLGFNADETTISPGNASTLQPGWFRGIGGAEGPVAIAGGIAYAGGVTGVFQAIDAASGFPLWSVSVGQPIIGTAAVWSGIVFIPAYDDKLHAYDAITGAPLWSYDFGYELGGAPLVSSGIVYLAGDAFDARTGTLLWQWPHGEVEAVARGVAYTGGEIAALDAKTGALLWQNTDYNQAARSGIAVVNGVIYGASVFGTMYAYSAHDGHVIWSQPLGGEIYGGAPAVANGIVYIGSTDHQLYAFDAATGTPVWVAPLSGRVGTPVVANGVVYVGTEAADAYALDAATGSVLWHASVTCGCSSGASPVVANGTVYVSTTKLFTYRLPPPSSS